MKQFSEKVMYELKESSYRESFGLENLLPCRHRRERQQMTVFMDAVQQVFEDGRMAAVNGGPVNKSGKQTNRALRFASLERVGQLIALGRASKSNGIKTNGHETGESRTTYVLDVMPDPDPNDAQDALVNLEIIARDRWHEPIATWPVHNENHKTTVMDNKIFDPNCLRCWLDRVAAQEFEKIATAIHRS